MRPRPIRSTAATVVALLIGSACGGPEEGMEQVVIPSGASLREVSDTLEAHDLVGWPPLFRLHARLRGDDDQIRAGTYDIPRDASRSEILDRLVEGRVVTVALTVPEGWTIDRIAERIAPIVELDPDSVAARLLDPALADSLAVPGPTLEGYLFPETYRFAQGLTIERIASTMVDAYRRVWTPARRATLDSLDLDERQLVTLASIVQAEARWEDEMPRISAVYHNRLRRGMRLQADPTVQYALESRRSRLLYRDIESVADHPYNTYSRAGLPPGPIGAPGLEAIDAALRPADVPYLYFVARDDGRHVFSRSLREHNNAIQRLRATGRHGGR